ncbi:hypothetical protein MATL_G00107560 [Megalops atlanticus]|uniref:Uncharacterized protein n=1 Tax=Megalops atlanticus TaxID=7932 RepID=A0A9D3T6F4_MEGAT|nr:hypothetical protein MATL_G00107560 [Megalops atlanticus]
MVGLWNVGTVAYSQPFNPRDSSRFHTHTQELQPVSAAQGESLTSPSKPAEERGVLKRSRGRPGSDRGRFDQP